ncbi:MAG TPA: hypothetical protein VGV59_03880 [Pyrinomonadaceae bacterium]|nr:hypothetical protein [Pyrinomonadaceae bacterium]
MKAVLKTLTALAVCVAATCGAVSAQRTRAISDPAASTTTATVETPPQQQPAQPATTGGQSNQSVTTPKPAPAPSTVKAKYEGGVAGFGKSDGTLTFDDTNKRLVFRDKKKNQEMFSVPYAVVFAAWADTQSRRSTAGSVIASTVPYGLGLPALFMKNKARYLTLQYRDPDTRAEGIATFKLESKELLASVLYTFAEKAGLTQRGEGFIRRREMTPEPTSHIQ